MTKTQIQRLLTTFDLEDMYNLRIDNEMATIIVHPTLNGNNKILTFFDMDNELLYMVYEYRISMLDNISVANVNTDKYVVVFPFDVIQEIAFIPKTKALRNAQVNAALTGIAYLGSDPSDLSV